MFPKLINSRKREARQYAGIHAKTNRSSRGGWDREGNSPVNQIGLTILHTPDAIPRADIIFVHGLGGTSMHTWSKDKNSDLFWPKRWLTREPLIQCARISTFGYDAGILPRGAQNKLNIMQFAKDLLGSLRYAADEAEEETPFGQIPVIFVAHSMGGLVVKKAYILGRDNQQFERICNATCAMLFLSTPHRGSNLASYLDSILKLIEAREYVSELRRHSTTLVDINDHFRNFVSNLEIVSFYETLKTRVAGQQKMVVEFDSSAIGYPNEISKPMTADHHSICKYLGRDDPNYISVRKVLKDWIHRLGRGNDYERNSSTLRKLRALQALLSVTTHSTPDYQQYHLAKKEGTCCWVLDDEVFQNWVDETSNEGQIVWLHAPPGNGKTILASFIVHHLRDERGLPCQFYRFQPEYPTENSLESFLRSMAYQTACQIPKFTQYLVRLSQEGLDIDVADHSVLWKILFIEGLFNLSLSRPIFWVVDGFEACLSGHIFISYLERAKLQRFPLRIMILSRQSPELNHAFLQLQTYQTLTLLAANGMAADLKSFVIRKAQYLPGDASTRNLIAARILQCAGNSFLWADLVLKELIHCNDMSEAEHVMRSCLPGITAVYREMEQVLSRTWKDRDRLLASEILTWVCCTTDTLDLTTIEEIIQCQSHHPLFDTRHTVSRILGEFVVIDDQSKISLLHHTAKNYFLDISDHPLYIDPLAAQCQILQKCLLCMTRGLVRFDRAESLPNGLLRYATTSWYKHLLPGAEILKASSFRLLESFFESPSFFHWISILASMGTIQTIVHASRALTDLLYNIQKPLASDSAGVSTATLVKIEKWALDLLNLVGKFGPHLLRFPSSIHELIPPFCPLESFIYEQFARKGGLSPITVSGLSNRNEWDDCRGSISIEKAHRAVNILCGRIHLALSSSSPKGTIHLYCATTLVEIATIVHGERVLQIQFGPLEHKLIVYGYKTTKVWDLINMTLLHAYSNPNEVSSLAFAVVRDGEDVLMAGIDGLVRTLSLTDTTSGWKTLNFTLVEPATTEFQYPRAPSCVSISYDGNFIAAAYYGLPIALFATHPPRLIRHIESQKLKNNTENAWADVTSMEWSPDSRYIFITHNDGCCVKMDLLGESRTLVLDDNLFKVKCSPCGNFILTIGLDSTYKILSFDDLSTAYQLTSPGTNRVAAISPIGKRIYELKDHRCIVREPMVLNFLRQGQNMFWPRCSLHKQQKLVASSPPTVSLGISSTSSMYSYGNLCGSLNILTKDSKNLGYLDFNPFSIEHLRWSDDDQYLVATDSGARVHIISIDAAQGKVSNEVDFSANRPINQILINNRSSHLLISCSGLLEIRSLKHSFVISRQIPSNHDYIWSNHPFQSDLLLGICPEDILVLHWKDLSENSRLPLSWPDSLDTQQNPLSAALMGPPQEDSARNSRVKIIRVLETSDGSTLLIQHRMESLETVCQYSILHVPEILGSGQGANFINVTPLPEKIQDSIEIPLGFVHGNAIASRKNRLRPSEGNDESLVFLDREACVCSISMTQVDVIQRHHVLPLDWLNFDYLDLARISKHGVLFCPYNDEVAIVQGGLRSFLS